MASDSMKKAKSDIDDYKFEDRLDDFVTYFVKELEAILIFHYDILEGNATKSGKAPTVIAQIIGIGVKYLTNIGGMAKLLKKPLEIPLEMYYENVSYKYNDIVYRFHKFQDQTRKLFVKIGIDVFESFEHQFMGVTTDRGPREALKRLARDAAERFLNFVKENDKISESFSGEQPAKTFEPQNVVFGESKTEFLDFLPTEVRTIKNQHENIPNFVYLKPKTPGYPIIYKVDKSEVVWTTASLFEKAGMIIKINDKLEARKREKSRCDKYFFRQPFKCENNWEKEYNIVTETDINFKYTDSSVYSNMYEKILRKINDGDGSSVQRRTLELVEELVKNFKDGFESVTDENKKYYEEITQTLKEQCNSFLEAFNATAGAIHNSVKDVGTKVTHTHELVVQATDMIMRELEVIKQQPNVVQIYYDKSPSQREQGIEKIYNVLKMDPKITNTELDVHSDDNILDKCIMLLKRGANFDAADENGQTLLHWGAENGKDDFCRILLKYGANFNSGDINGLTALNYAAVNGNEEICEMLLEKGAKCNVADRNGQTILHWGAENGKVNLCRLLLKYKATYDDGDVNGHTPLYRAMVNGREDVCKLLLENRVNCDIADVNGQTLLHWAAEYGKVTFCALLLKYRANVNIGDVNGLTPLHRAMENGKEDICRLLLENKANANAADKNGQTLLHWAAEMGKFRLCSLLLEYKASLNAGDVNGQMPLNRAVINGKEDICDLLLENGAKCDVADKNGETLLHWAAGNGKFNLCSLLLKYKANLDAGDVNGHTPLYRAAVNGKEDVCELLLKRGAKTNVADQNGRTLLHWAAENGKVDLCRLLVQFNANLKAGDVNGRTPLDLAAANNREDICSLLR